MAARYPSHVFPPHPPYAKALECRVSTPPPSNGGFGILLRCCCSRAGVCHEGLHHGIAVALYVSPPDVQDSIAIFKCWVCSLASPLRFQFGFAPRPRLWVHRVLDWINAPVFAMRVCIAASPLRFTAWRARCHYDVQVLGSLSCSAFTFCISASPMRPSVVVCVFPLPCRYCFILC